MTVMTCLTHVYPHAVLGFHPSIAPIKAAVFPLVNNKAELSELAKQLFRSLQMRFMVEYDTSGAIGRRYRRYDTYCIYEMMHGVATVHRDRIQPLSDACHSNNSCGT